MIHIHPDDANISIQLRQSIVREGMLAARRPGDLAALRERIGQMLIAAGQKLQGSQPSLPAREPWRMVTPAH
jgi:hypothetical protein